MWKVYKADRMDLWQAEAPSKLSTDPEKDCHLQGESEERPKDRASSVGNTSYFFVYSGYAACPEHLRAQRG